MNKGEQIRRLTDEGRQALADMHERERIRADFLATHDQDFMQGILDVPPGTPPAEVDAAIAWWHREYGV